MTPALAVFLQAPRLGTVKTRLAAEVGDRHALRLYRVMAARTLAAARAAGLEHHSGSRRPTLAGDALLAGRRVGLRPQASGDLGVRLGTAARAADAGRAWLAVVADCPRLDATLLLRGRRDRGAGES